MTSGQLKPRPLKVSVLVNLFWHAGAGGHVKCWERLAEAAAGYPDKVCLTVHFLGNRMRIIQIASNVTYKIWQPMFPSYWIPFLSHIPDHTDLAPYHFGLAKHLVGDDVIHTTEAISSFAKTAIYVSRKREIPLVNSTHTDTSNYAQIYTAQLIERYLGHSMAARLFTETIDLPRWAARKVKHKTDRHQSEALINLFSGLAYGEGVTDRSGVASLGRGLDFNLFKPSRSDRSTMAYNMGISEEAMLIAYAGRIDESKNISLLRAALNQEWLARENAHLIFSGKGSGQKLLQEHFGKHATFTGVLDQKTLASVLASADLFVFPSTYDISSNAIREALACGTGVLVASDALGGCEVVEDETGYYLPASDPLAWRCKLAKLARNKSKMDRLGVNAHEWALSNFLSWEDVFKSDLLPAWELASEYKFGKKFTTTDST